MIDVLALLIQDPIERWLVFIETIRIETVAYCSRKKFIENKLKSFCEENISLLEQDPMLSKNPTLQGKYEQYLTIINDWTIRKIHGHQNRIQTQPKSEIGEPNIAFFAELEIKTAKKKSITELKSKSGDMKYEIDDLKEVAVDFYSDLFKHRLLNTRTGKVKACEIF